MDQRAARLARGDPAAFAELYDACAGRIYNYLVVRLGSRSDADDILQETFVCLARTRKRLAKVDNLAAYVFATARNEAIRLLDRRARQGRLRTDASLDSFSCRATVDGFRDIESAEWAAASLARLGPELRDVVELKIYGDLTFREIAELTGLPQGTVATRYRMALEKMRSQMAKESE
jgi:RNA polymerase sigma-70 factor (ECF subfamily)